jgi:hypothetical protein
MLPLELAIDVGHDDGGACRAPEEVESMVIADTVGIDCRLDARDRRRRVERHGSIRVREARGQKIGADGRRRVGARLQVLGAGGADAAQEAGRDDDDGIAAEAGTLPLRIGSPHVFLIRAAIARTSFEWTDVKARAHEHRIAAAKSGNEGGNGLSSRMRTSALVRFRTSLLDAFLQWKKIWKSARGQIAPPFQPNNVRCSICDVSARDAVRGCRPTSARAA